MPVTLRGKPVEAIRQFLVLRLTRPELFRPSDRSGYRRAVDFYGLRGMFRAFAGAFAAYHRSHGRYPDLVHPKTYTEKVVWQKFFTALPVPQAGNKLLTGSFIPPDLPELTVVPIVYHSAEARLPPNDALAPGWYYLKSNYGSDMFRPVEYPLSPEDRVELEALAARWLKGSYGLKTGEWWYNLIPKEILLEPSISGAGAAAAWCFHVLDGQVASIVLVRKIGEETQVVRLAPDFTVATHQSDKRPRLQDYDDHGLKDELTRLALGVARPFGLIRVDLYVTDAREIYLGEVTFSPSNGLVRYPPEWDLAYGAMLRSIS